MLRNFGTIKFSEALTLPGKLITLQLAVQGSFTHPQRLGHFAPIASILCQQLCDMLRLDLLEVRGRCGGSPKVIACIENQNVCMAKS